MTETNTPITVQVIVNAPVEKVWELWTTSKHIKEWNKPSNEWQNLDVSVDLKENGKFLFRMQSKDDSDGFDYTGRYDKIIHLKLIELTTNDARKTSTSFLNTGEQTVIAETFEPEDKTPLHIQKEFCQGVLLSFKKYAETI